jgi:very-short-patch-repair endonuclease
MRAEFGSGMDVVERAREFRRSPTPAEAALWEVVRGRRFYGFRFRRQHPVGPYVAGFFCFELGLVVEVDGGVHDGDGFEEKDEERTIWLEKLGFKVVRLQGEDVLADPRAALTQGLTPGPVRG